MQYVYALRTYSTRVLVGFRECNSKTGHSNLGILSLLQNIQEHSCHHHCITFRFVRLQYK